MGLKKPAAVLIALAGLGLVPTMSASPRLQVNTTSVGALFVSPGNNAPAQTVQAYNAGDGTLSPSVSTSASWLSAAVGASQSCSLPGGTCWPVTLTFNTAALATGTYTEYAVVSDPNAVDSPEQIAVTVVVANVPGSVTLYAAPNGGTASVPVFPQSAAVGSVSTQSGGNWLTFNAPTGNVSFGAAGFIIATTQSGQAPGNYSGTVTLSGSKYAPDNHTVNVTLVVTSSPVLTINNSQIVLNGYAGGPKVNSGVTFANIGQGTLAITATNAVSSSGNFLTASVANGNTITITADPSQLTAGTYNGTVTITSNAANNSQVSIPVEFSVAPAGKSTILQGGMVNIATYISDPVAPGDIVAVFGDQFAAPGSGFQNTGLPPLATKLGNTSVLVNGVAAPLFYVGQTQINFQVPYEAPAGQIATVQVVNNGVGGNIRSLQVAATAPRVLVWPSSVVQGNYGIVVNSDNTLSLPANISIGLPSRASHPGDYIVIYCVGLGQTTPVATTGAAASSNPLMSTGHVTVSFGGATAQSVFAGLTPTAVGLNQINVQIPAGAPIGSSVPVTITMGNLTTNTINIPIAAQ